MVTGRYTLAQLLAELKRNVSRTDLPREAGLVQIRKEAAVFTIGITYTPISWGPTYFVYPQWNDDDLQNWWKLGEIEVARDIIGSLDGVVNGNTTTDSEIDFTDTMFSPVRKRYYHVFDGNGDFINVGDIASLDGTSVASFGCRVRFNRFSFTDHIMARWPSANSNKQFRLNVSASGNLRWIISTTAGGAFAQIEMDDAIDLDTWYNVVFTYNGANSPSGNRGKIYVNGVLQDTTESLGTIPTTLRTVTGDVLIGRREDNSGFDFKGNLYDVVYWNVELNQAQVTAFNTDDISDSIMAGSFKVPGDLVDFNSPIPPIRTISITTQRRKRHNIQVAIKQLTPFV